VASGEDAVGETRRARGLILPKLAGAFRSRERGGATTLPETEALDPVLPTTRAPRVDARALTRRAALALWRSLPAIGAGLAASIPVLRSTIDAANAGWVPAGDDGIIATRGWDVLTSHTPLVGQYSEAGLVIHGQVMHSPGPMLYWLIALPARFGSVTSIAVTMGIVNTLAIIGCVILARRRGGLVLMFMTAIGIALMSQSLPTEALHDIWNPAAGLFPFLLLIFLGWALACGDYRLLPLTALVACFVTQTHLMYAAPTAVLLAVGLGGLFLRRLGQRRRARSPRRPAARAPLPRIWPWALAAAVIAAACWTPPLVDELENNPGNLTMVVRTVEHHGTALGSAVGWAAVVRSVGVRPWWLYVPTTEWDRKYDVGAVARTRGAPLGRPSGSEVDSAIAIIGALAAVGLFAAFMLEWDLAAAAAIGLGMCAAIGLQAAANPAATLLAGTLGYTLWWGSELGFFVYLVLAWALWLGLVAITKPARRSLRRRLPELPARGRLLALTVATLAALGATAAVGEAVAAAQWRPDSHHPEYRPVRAIAAGIERLIPPGQTINYRFGALGIGTQPMEPAIRFFLVRHGDRVLAVGSFPRLGSYYELYHRPVQWTVYLTDGSKPRRHMTLAARVHFTDAWGHETLSAWVRRV
jgi:hypothetical protein